MCLEVPCHGLVWAYLIVQSGEAQGMTFGELVGFRMFEVVQEVIF